jgi:hypothetical protein
MLLLAAAPLAAQSELALKRAFEGRSVRVRLNMPATHLGVDVRFRQNPAVDFPAYGQRIKNFGVALRDGDSATVTAIKVKDKIIEFQLDGGGYGTWSDESSYVSTPTYGRSERERQLDREIEREPDARRKDELRRERARLEDIRRRQEMYDQQRAEQLREMKEARIAERRLRGGSRFNIRYPDGYLRETIPTPEEIIAILEPYVDFGALAPEAVPPRGWSSAPVAPQPRLTVPSADQLAAPPPAAVSGAGARMAAPAAASRRTTAGAGTSPFLRLRKGLTRGEVESIFGGPPARTRQSKEGTLEIDTDVWEQDGQIYEVDYTSDIVIRYRVTAK